MKNMMKQLEMGMQGRVIKRQEIIEKCTGKIKLIILKFDQFYRDRVLTGSGWKDMRWVERIWDGLKGRHISPLPPPVLQIATAYLNDEAEV